MNLDNIKKLTLRAIISDEILMYGLILKGGNALQLAYDITNRGSLDIDFSMEKDFTKEEYERLKGSFEIKLNAFFNEEGLQVYDVKFKEKPKQGSIPEWKGYQLEFKLIDINKYNKYKENKDKLRRESVVIDEDSNSTRYIVDISAYEYVKGAKNKEIEGTILRVYTPEMILVEKLRALCQSMLVYKQIVSTANQKQRARDLYDIYIIRNHFTKLEITKELVDNIFSAKRVPVDFLRDIEILREHNRSAWTSVVQTIDQKEDLKEYDFYFDEMKKVVNIILDL